MLRHLCCELRAKLDEACHGMSVVKYRTVCSSLLKDKINQKNQFFDILP